MSVSIDPQPLQILEHKQRLLEERLRQVMAKQFDLLQQEGEIRTQLTHNENERYRILKG